MYACAHCCRMVRYAPAGETPLLLRARRQKAFYLVGQALIPAPSPLASSSSPSSPDFSQYMRYIRARSLPSLLSVPLQPLLFHDTRHASAGSLSVLLTLLLHGLIGFCKSFLHFLSVASPSSRIQKAQQSSTAEWCCKTSLPNTRLTFISFKMDVARALSSQNPAKVKLFVVYILASC